jgi:hypothetical protein
MRTTQISEPSTKIRTSFADGLVVNPDVGAPDTCELVLYPPPQAPIVGPFVGYQKNIPHRRWSVSIVRILSDIGA